MSTSLDISKEMSWLQNLDKPDRVLFLAMLSHNLTIAMRVLGVYSKDLREDFSWVRLVNEANHQVSGYVMHSLSGKEDPRWIQVVVKNVLNSSDEAAGQQMKQAWLVAQSGLSQEKGHI